MELLIKRFLVTAIDIKKRKNRCDLWTGVKQWNWGGFWDGNAGPLIGKATFTVLGIIFMYTMLGTFYYCKTSSGWPQDAPSRGFYYLVVAVLVCIWDWLMGLGISSFQSSDPNIAQAPKDIFEVAYFWLLPASWADSEDGNWDAQDLFTFLSKLIIIVGFGILLGKFFWNSSSFGKQRKSWWMFGIIGIIIYIILPPLIFATTPKCKLTQIFDKIERPMGEGSREKGRDPEGSFSGLACAFHKFGGLQTLLIFILWFVYNDRSVGGGLRIPK